jgi:hypothetical protein
VLQRTVLRVKPLNCIVGQMHRCSLDIVQRVSVTRHADIAFSKQVTVMLMGDQHPKSDVKFALVDQKGPLDVLLDHEQV